MLFNHLFINLKNIMLINHNRLLNNNLTFDEINIIKKKSIFDNNDINLSKLFKNLYQTIFYLFDNITNKLIFNYLIDNTMVELILKNQDLNMEEIRTKTEKATNGNPDLYRGIVEWIAGNCWLNALTTNGYKKKLTHIDKYIINSINKSIQLIEPMSKPLVLFHGLELYSNYNEKHFKLGHIFTFKGILSKTTCFRIAQKFAQSQNYLQPKYIVVYYPIGSKHLGLDIKPSVYDEYEYIGKFGEKFRIKKIYKRFNGLQLETFYICDSLDY